MYGIEVQTPAAAGPLTAADLRAWLRLNDTAEDATLTDLLAAAVDLFEDDTRRPVLQTTYRQHLGRWPSWRYEPGLVGPHGSPWRFPPGYPDRPRPGEIVLGRGGVSSVSGVYRNLADGTTQTLSGYVADLKTPPARVTLAAIPDPVQTAAGVDVSPVGYVEFVAGWANAAAVPPVVKTAIKLLASHWYENREAYAEKSLGEVQSGWSRVTNKYRLGLSGDWGQ